MAGRIRKRILPVISAVVAILLMTFPETFARYQTAAEVQTQLAVLGYHTAVCSSQDSEAFALLFDGAAAYPGMESVTSFQVQSSSSVRVGYRISVTSSNNLPLYFALTPAGKSEEEIMTATGTGRSLTGSYSAPVPLEAGEHQNQTFSLRVLWPAGDNATVFLDEIDSVIVSVDCWQTA